MSEKVLNKIDFDLLVSVSYANPNGDPLNGNRPRTDYNDFGEISDVCIKRKIRNRMQDLGHNIFVQSADRADDGVTSLQKRYEQFLNEGDKSKKNNKQYICEQVCKKWLDVRTFGQVFAFKGKDDKSKKDSTDGESIGIRGPVSIQYATSVAPVEVKSIQITKSVNGSDSDKKGSDTMGRKNMVRFGLYRIKGAINPQLAERTGFTYEDALVIKECLRTLFVNDASSARPEGSIEVVRLYWWEHHCKYGQYSSAVVHRSLHLTKKEGIDAINSIDDFDIQLDKLDGLEPEIIDGV